MNLLIADDEPLEREVLTRMIKDYKFGITRYFEAQDGADAVAVTRSERIDFVIMDIKMPVMDGLTAAERIKAEYPDCRIIFLTAYDEERYAGKGIHEIGAEDYLLKPVHPNEVKQALARFIPIISYTDRQLQDGKDPIEKIKEYIQLHIEHELTLENLAAIVHLNPQYVSRLFKKKTSLTLTDYIIHSRLEKAKRLLATTNFCVAEISERCGLLDPNYFSRVFRKYEGMTPTQYRQQQKAIQTVRPYQFHTSFF
jgi:two-component system response regulator YesN